MIATYNVKGINGRLPVVLRWRVEAEPDIVRLQEFIQRVGKLSRARSASKHMKDVHA